MLHHFWWNLVCMLHNRWVTMCENVIVIGCMDHKLWHKTWDIIARIFKSSDNVRKKCSNTLSYRPYVKSSPFPPWSMLRRPICQPSARVLATLFGGGRGGVCWRGAFRLSKTNLYFYMTILTRAVRQLQYA